MIRSSVRFIAIAFAVPLVAACGGPGATETPSPPPSGPTGQSAANPEGLTDAQIEAIYRERMEASRTRWTEADVHFMTGMIHHHAQAVQMSRLAPTHGASPAIRTLAARIINAQQDEIATMQRWLRDRDQPVPELHTMGDEVMVHGGMAHDGTDMPGMLSPEQLETLERARGLEFDRLYLTFMIEHHQGAVVLVRELFATDGAAQDEDAFRFASDVQVDQDTEIARMKLMLEALPEGDGGP